MTAVLRSTLNRPCRCFLRILAYALASADDRYIATSTPLLVTIQIENCC